MAQKVNCWEFKKCGREPGGSKVLEFGVCPASISKEHDKCNNGKNAGRFCWIVAGTFCGGNVQGTYASKALNCCVCKFYKQVKQEEGKDFVVLKKRY